MRFGHVRRDCGVEPALVISMVRGDALAVVEEFHRHHRETRIHRLVDERVRHRVVVVVDLDVIVDVDAAALPVGVDEALGGQRPQRGPVEPLKQSAAAGAVDAHRALVQVVEQLGDTDVEGGEREEGLVAEPGQDPALGDLHRHLDLRLVPG